MAKKKKTTTRKTKKKRKARSSKVLEIGGITVTKMTFGDIVKDMFLSSKPIDWLLLCLLIIQLIILFKVS